MRTSTNRPSTYSTTAVVQKDRLDIENISQGSVPEPVLSDRQYEHILGIIKRLTNTMERTPATYKGMGEEELRDIILANLNSHYEGNASAEAFNASGKTDILIRDQDKNVFIAECKIWSGPKMYSDTIDQLLGYTSWRDTKTALVIFNRNKNLSSVLEQIPNLTKDHRNFRRELGKAGETDFRYVLHHDNDEARELYLAVLVIEIPV
jgi:hypothetical protein